MTLTALERKAERLYRDCLLTRIAHLEALLEERPESGMYEIEFDLRKLTPSERETIRTILVDIESREAAYGNTEGTSTS